MSIVAVLGLVMATARLVLGGPASSIFLRSFEFPLSFANGVAGDLIVPIGSASKLSFDSGKVAIGNLPATDTAGALGTAPPQPRSALHAASGPAPRARLLLNGVIDADGNLVSNTGNQLLIDAAVSPGSAALTPQPFAFPFDINGGLAFLDVALPIPARSDGSVRVQIVGVTVVDPDGQAFAALGFELPAAQRHRRRAYAGGDPTPKPRAVLQGPNCTGQSVRCRRTSAVALPVQRHIPGITSWCPPDQIDPSTGDATPTRARRAATAATGRPAMDPVPCGAPTAVFNAGYAKPTQLPLQRDLWPTTVPDGGAMCESGELRRALHC